MTIKPIYWNHTPINTGGSSLDVTLVVRSEGGALTYRVTLHWDRSYAFQTHGEIAVLDGAEFKTVLTLRHHDMMRFAAFDSMEPQRRGAFERDGKLPTLLRDQADEMAALGMRIVESGRGQ